MASAGIENYFRKMRQYCCLVVMAGILIASWINMSGQYGNTRIHHAGFHLRMRLNFFKYKCICIDLHVRWLSFVPTFGTHEEEFDDDEIAVADT
jgi:hypothetical protein